MCPPLVIEVILEFASEKRLRGGVARADSFREILEDR
jgi:hypothetical protein